MTACTDNPVEDDDQLIGQALGVLGAAALGLVGEVVPPAASSCRATRRDGWPGSVASSVTVLTKGPRGRRPMPSTRSRPSKTARICWRAE